MNILVWGIGADYELCRNLTKYETQNGFINIVALINSFEMKISFLDNIKVILPFQIEELEYDYIFIASHKKYKTILEEAIKIGVQREKILSFELFMIPDFDILSYLKVRESKISLISEDCFSGLFYHEYDLPFMSPFINTAISTNDYFRLISNLKYYMTKTLQKVTEGNVDTYPVGRLDDIEIKFYHYGKWSDIVEIWERRIERFNVQNYFVIMTLYSDEDARRFNDLPIENKIGFYFRNLQLKSVIYLPEWNDYRIRQEYAHQFSAYVRSNLNKLNGAAKAFSMLKILAGETDYIRKKE